jgi:RNA-directed DNA polymerase
MRMARRALERHLFEQVISFDNLWRATQRAAKGKRNKASVARFLAHLEPNLFALQRALEDGSWRPQGYTMMEVREPKVRQISVAPFADRVIHQALCAVISPLFERSFISDSYANRQGYGTHRAVDRYELFSSRHPWVLRADIFRYFPSIDRAILKTDVRRYIACPRTLDLIDRIIDGSNPQEPVHLYFTGDDLFAPYSRSRGLPIGNLTSQWFGNLYLNCLDHFIKEVLRAPGYVRYADDFAVFANSREQIDEWRDRIAQFLEGRRLILHPRKTEMMQSSTRTQFLGYVLLPDGRRRLPEDNVNRFRARLSLLRQQYRRQLIDDEDVKCSVSAWIGHARHADTVSLRRTLFRGGWFDPLWESCPSALRGGSWNNNPQNTRSANRNNNDTGNRNNNIGFRLASTPNAGADTTIDVSGVFLAVQDG